MANRTPQILEYPVELAARRHALGLLDDAVKAAARVEGGQDADALHDFRVTARRLRTMLKAYGPWLGPEAEGSRRRLGKIVDQTNSGRDREVHVKWLSAQLTGRASPRVKTGVRLMLDEIESSDRVAGQVDMPALLRKFDKQQRKLRAMLVDTGTTAIAVQMPTTYASATAALIKAHAEALRQQLGLIANKADVDAAHQARLAGKRLRYVMEPVAPHITGAKAALDRLKSVQDLLGELHDLHVLEDHVIDAARRGATDWAQSLVDGEGDASPLGACRALAAVARRVRAEQSRLFRQIERQWLGNRSDRFFSTIQKLVLRLEPPQQAAAPSEPPVQPTEQSDAP